MRKRIFGILSIIMTISIISGCGTPSNKIDNKSSAEETATIQTQESNTEITPPQTYVIYDKMQFKTTVAKTAEQNQYQYTEEVDVENNIYTYFEKRDYSSSLQYYSIEGGYVYLQIGNNGCSFKTVNPNISTLNKLINNINIYTTAINNAEYRGRNDDYWVYYTRDNGSIDRFYEMLIPIGEKSPSCLLHMDNKNEKDAKAISKIDITGIEKLNCSAASFNECTLLSTDDMEKVIKAFNNDVKNIKTQTDVENFEGKLGEKLISIKEYYLKKIAGEDIFATTENAQ